MRRILAGLALALLIASPVLAAKPSTASCSIAPDPVAVGAPFIVSGADFEPSATFSVFIYKPSSVTFVYAHLDATGTLVPFTLRSWEPGLVTVELRPFPDPGAPTILASCGVTVT